MTSTECPVVAFLPPPFVRALRTWLCGVPSARLAPHLAAAAQLLERLVPGEAVALSEAHLRRLATRQTAHATEDDALGASVVLDLWHATRSGHLRLA